MFPQDEIERLLLYGKYNIPVRVPLAPMAGGNSPITLAGTLVQTNAEALGSLVVLQTLCPGIPTWYYIIMETMDMRMGSLQMFNPEIMLLYNGIFQMARRYGLPAAFPSGIGSGTDGHQIMFERGVGMMLNALVGACEIGGLGGLGNGLMISPELMVIDTDMFAFAQRYLEGFNITSETMALDAIHRQAKRGRFLEDIHTFTHVRREKRFTPFLFDWQSRLKGMDTPGSIFQRALDVVEDTKKSHEVPPLEEDCLKELDRILAAAKKHGES